jgi:hypothetical protein
MYGLADVRGENGGHAMNEVIILYSISTGCIEPNTMSTISSVADAERPTDKDGRRKSDNEDSSSSDSSKLYQSIQQCYQSNEQHNISWLLAK